MNFWHFDQKFIVLQEVWEFADGGHVFDVLMVHLKFELNIILNQSDNLLSIISITTTKMDKNYDKSTAINVFEVKPIKLQFSFKITCADIFNDFLYIGDEKGNIYSYPVRVNDPDVIAKSTNEQMKSISKSRIDKLSCYPNLLTVFVLSDEKLYQIDSALRKPQLITQKIYTFAINQCSSNKQNALQSIFIVTKKKEGCLLYYNYQTKKWIESAKFSLSELPTNVAYTGNHIVCSYKKDYQSFNVEKNFALIKGPIQSKNPYFKITGHNELVFFMDDVGLFMDGQFVPKQKDNINLVYNKPILDMSISGNYCLILCEGILQIYTIYDPKKLTFVQEIPINPNIKGITSHRPFVFGKQELMFLYVVPYETQIKALIEKGRVDDARVVLEQNVEPSEREQKFEELYINSVWPLLKKMQFQKAKQLIKTTNFDVRQLILLYPQISNSSQKIDSIKGIRPQKFMQTLILEHVSEKARKDKDQQNQLKKKSKYFLKDVLEFKRQQYLQKASSSMIKVKIQFTMSKYSLIKKQNLPTATPEELLQIIDFCLIKWYLDMGMFPHLQTFFSNNQQIFCKNLYTSLQNVIKSDVKLVQFPTLKPRFFSAFGKIQQAYESWKVVGQSTQKDVLLNQACEQSVKLLTQFEDKSEIYKKLLWILRKKPITGMSFFNKVDLNFIQPDQIIRNFEQQKNEKYLQLYLETIVLEKKTEIEVYHTKLLLLYIQGIFKIHPKDNKQESKNSEFIEKITKMRTLLRHPEAKYASQPVLKKIQKCEWLLEDQIFLYSRQKRHEQALRKYINKQKYSQAENYCKNNRDETLTIYFKLLLAMYKSFEASKNNASLLLKKDIITFLKKYSSDSELDPITVLELIPDNWMLNDSEGMGGIYPFLESAIIHTLHEKRSTYTAKHLSEMDLLNVEYNLIQAKKAYLRFTYKKKCVICNTPISDKYFVVYPNANVCHQACVKKQKNTVCPITKQDFERTFKY